MGDLTKNLSCHEFTCRCGCDFDTADSLVIVIFYPDGDTFKDYAKAKKST